MEEKVRLILSQAAQAQVSLTTNVELGLGSRMAALFTGGATLVTRNQRHFQDLNLAVINPFRD